MARFNEILVGRYNRMVQKLFSMKGGASLVTLADEATAVLPLFYGAENRYLEGWDRFGVAFSQGAGGVGNRAAIRLRNAAGSNVIAVIEKVTFFNALIDTPLLQVRSQTAELSGGASNPSNRFDPRGRPIPSLITSLTGNFGAVSGSQNWQGAHVAGSTVDAILDVDHEIPVLPGDALDLLAGTLNQALNATIFWRERFLEESERA